MSDINHGWEDKEPKEIILHPGMYEKYKKYPEKEKDIIYGSPRREPGYLRWGVIILFFILAIVILFIIWF